MKRLIIPFAIALITIVSSTSQSAYAAAASMSLSVSSGTVTKGSYVTVYVHENSGSEPVNGVQANFSYNAGLLQYVSISNSSAFGIVAQNSGGGGSVSIGRGALPAVSGSQLVASVQFKALASSGSAGFSFTGDSSVVSANSNTDIASNKSGASVSLVAPAPTPPPAPKDTTPPTISAIAVKDIGPNKATVTWTTSEPATSEVDYGYTMSYGLSASNGTLTANHSITLGSPLILAATTYHLLIKSADQTGNAATSSDTTFTTTGTTVTVVLTDKATNRPISGIKVSWNDQTAVTNAQGKATLANLPTGATTIAVHLGGVTEIQTIVIGAPTDTPQTVAFKVTIPATGWPWWLIALGGGLVMAGAVTASYMAGRGRLSFSRTPVGHEPLQPIKNPALGPLPTVTRDSAVISPSVQPQPESRGPLQPPQPRV